MSKLPTTYKQISDLVMKYKKSHPFSFKHTPDGGGFWIDVPAKTYGRVMVDENHRMIEYLIPGKVLTDLATKAGLHLHGLIRHRAVRLCPDDPKPVKCAVISVCNQDKSLTPKALRLFVTECNQENG